MCHGQQQQSLTGSVACEAALYTASAGGSGVNDHGHLVWAVFDISQIQDL